MHMPPAHRELLRAKLKLRQFDAVRQLQNNHPKTYKLLVSTGYNFKKLPAHSAKLLAGTALAGSLLLLAPSNSRPLPEIPDEKVRVGLAASSAINNWLSGKLSPLLPASPGHLTPENELKTSILIRSAYGVNAVPELSGHRLNHSYGYTGYEQHLVRFPGDSLDQHDDEKIAGLAPGLGGWGYFAPSRALMTENDYLREKYYFAVQTIYLPDWPLDYKNLSEWYKYRKMIMINPKNGKAVVGVVADSGPSVWTGKQFGASPEAAKHLDLHEKNRKGEVILYFIDDPENKVPLGPLEHNLASPSQLI